MKGLCSLLAVPYWLFPIGCYLREAWSEPEQVDVPSGLTPHCSGATSAKAPAKAVSKRTLQCMVLNTYRYGPGSLNVYLGNVYVAISIDIARI